MGKEILFTLAQDVSYNTTDLTAKLRGLQTRGFEKYYDPKFLEELIAARRQKIGDGLSFDWYPQNAPGQWMSQNVSAPSKVVPEPITLERVKEELDDEKFGYVVIATYLSGYGTFKDVANYVRQKRPDVKVIAAATGALIEESSQLVDYTLRGDQVSDLRAIIGQPETDPLKVVSVKSDTRTHFDGVTKTGSYALLISSLGCMYGCDFCPSTAQFGTNFVAPFSAEEIRDEIIAAHDRIAPGSKIFSVSLAEPQGLGNIRLWREVFSLCRDLPFQCDLVTTTSSKIVQKFSLDELTQGALRLSTINIGVESLLQGYRKNKNVDLKTVINRLQNAGINVVSTFIVGFDWHTKKNVKDEIELLRDLGSSGYIAANLEMKPKTPLYNAYKTSGRLLDVPPELLSFYGYQAFTHPHFAAGFNDMLPLLEEIGGELSDGNRTLGANLAVYLSRQYKPDSQQRSTINRMLADFKAGLDPEAYPDGISTAVEKFAAQLYFHLVFRQMDLFHPFIII